LFGIPRLDMQAIPKPAMDLILSETIPLGRALIEHGVLRRVELCHLWKVTAGADLAKLCSIPVGEAVYGRTAMIHVDEVPAIELLEIVTN
jgi:chorismate-pyruvate lyase